jgi:hypothetical protein
MLIRDLRMSTKDSESKFFASDITTIHELKKENKMLVHDVRIPTKDSKSRFFASDIITIHILKDVDVLIYSGVEEHNSLYYFIRINYGDLIHKIKCKELDFYDMEGYVVLPRFFKGLYDVNSDSIKDCPKTTEPFIKEYGNYIQFSVYEVKSCLPGKSLEELIDLLKTYLPGVKINYYFMFSVSCRQVNIKHKPINKDNEPVMVKEDFKLLSNPKLMELLDKLVGLKVAFVEINKTIQYCENKIKEYEERMKNDKILQNVLKRFNPHYSNSQTEVPVRKLIGEILAAKRIYDGIYLPEYVQDYLGTIKLVKTNELELAERKSILEEYEKLVKDELSKYNRLDFLDKIYEIIEKRVSKLIIEELNAKV